VDKCESNAARSAFPKADARGGQTRVNSGNSDQSGGRRPTSVGGHGDRPAEELPFRTSQFEIETPSVETRDLA
jgi:hypothetical protein